jgi:hypothetical protein
VAHCLSRGRRGRGGDLLVVFGQCRHNHLQQLITRAELLSIQPRIEPSLGQRDGNVMRCVPVFMCMAHEALCICSLRSGTPG